MTDACPNCGYCKHCGRSDRPAPYVFPRPQDETTADPYSFRHVTPRVWIGGPPDPNVTVTLQEHVDRQGNVTIRYTSPVYSWQ